MLHKLDPDPFRILTKLFSNDFFISDDEAKVLGHLPGKGKHKGLMGALLVEMPNKKTFQVGSGYVLITPIGCLNALHNRFKVKGGSNFGEVLIYFLF
jgi:ATP-dependent DNA ligase